MEVLTSGASVVVVKAETIGLSEVAALVVEAAALVLIATPALGSSSSSTSRNCGMIMVAHPAALDRGVAISSNSCRRGPG